MAAKPIERHIKRQIQEQGGWDRILERIASGETVADISRSFLRPDGVSISRAFFSRLLHADPARSQAVLKARDEGSDAMVDDALHGVEIAPRDRDSTNHAKVRAELKLKVAGFINRERWGEAKQAVNVTVNQNSLHLDALRHRIIEASRPLAAALKDYDDPVLLGADTEIKGLKAAAQTANSATVRHRMIEASRPLAEALGQASEFTGVTTKSLMGSFSADHPMPDRPIPAEQTPDSATDCACGTDTHEHSQAEDKPKELKPGSVESQKLADSKWLRESA